MTDSNEIGAEVTKQTYRKQIWDHIIKNQLTKFPMSVVNRIPIFKGSTEAAQRILLLDEFVKAKVIKVNHIASQEPVRFLALEAKKEILIPMLKMESRLFNHVVPESDNKKDIKHLASTKGIEAFGKKLGLDSDIKVDLIVLGSVCVTRKGERIGTGEGFADLEFAILKRMGAVTEDTTVVTTVHDCQIIDDVPSNLFEKHDVPVDVILTPTETIIINKKLRKPGEIFWDILTPSRVKSLKALQQLRAEDEKNGKKVELKAEKVKQRSERATEKRISRRKEQQKDQLEIAESEDVTTAGNEGIVEILKKEARRNRVPRKRQPREEPVTTTTTTTTTKTGERESSTDPTNTEQQRREKSRRKSTKSRGKANIDFSLKLSNIKSDMRVRDLKNALFERGVRPTDIAWHGQRGYCYLHFGKLRNKEAKLVEPVQVDSIVKNLENLRIGPINENDCEENEYIVVEPAKPITRIEITDVTAV